MLIGAMIETGWPLTMQSLYTEVALFILSQNRIVPRSGSLGLWDQTGTMVLTSNSGRDEISR